MELLILLVFLNSKWNTFTVIQYNQSKKRWEELYLKNWADKTKANC